MDGKMRLGELDLNLLLVFDQLIRQRSVTIAAEEMNVSQPTVSNALKRLRDLLGDKLFVRGANGMEPTSRALQLAEPVAYALNCLEQALKHQERFDSDIDTRNFVLALTESVYSFIPPLVSTLEQKQAKIEFTFVSGHRGTLKEAMEDGSVDLAFGYLPHLEANFYKKRMYRDRFVFAMRKGHPLSRKRVIRPEDLALMENVTIRPSNSSADVLESMVDGAHYRSRVTVDSWGMVATVLQSTDMVATIPERLAKRFAEPYEIEYRTHPINLPQRATEMYWHERVHRDSGVRWLRGLIIELFGDQE